MGTKLAEWIRITKSHGTDKEDFVPRGIGEGVEDIAKILTTLGRSIDCQLLLLFWGGPNHWKILSWNC